MKTAQLNESAQMPITRFAGGALPPGAMHGSSMREMCRAMCIVEHVTVMSCVFWAAWCGHSGRHLWEAWYLPLDQGFGRSRCLHAPRPHVDGRCCLDSLDAHARGSRSRTAWCVIDLMSAFCEGCGQQDFASSFGNENGIRSSVREGVYVLSDVWLMACSVAVPFLTDTFFFFLTGTCLLFLTGTFFFFL